MNKIVYIVLLSIAIASCASTKQTNTTGGGTQDGSSFENAVVAKNVRSEYDWVNKNYPESQVQSQALVNNKRKYYDVLTVKLADGSAKTFYFDINSFYGKGF